MSKKLRPYIIALSILLAIVIIAQFLPAGKSRAIDLLKFDNKYSNLSLRSFNVRDTASITKIFIVDKNSRSVTLDRVGNTWVLNNKYPARQDAVQLLLETLLQMRVKMPVAISAREEILRKMSSKSMKVEIYQGTKNVKTMYIGGVTQDNLGSYMLLEGSDTPYVLEIPGFRGYLSSRFSTDEKNWRSNLLIGEKPDDIKRVEFDYTENKRANFTIVQPEVAKYELYNVDMQKATSFDTLSVKGFIEQFEIANFSMFVDMLSDEVKDSVRNSIPLFTIRLTDAQDSIQNYYFYEIPDVSEQIDPMERTLYPSNMWVFNNNNDWMIIQTHTYLLMFRQFNDFRPVVN